jgi:hypothetical protein
MITTNIEWHKTAEELPEKSGTYLLEYGLYKTHIMTVTYSSRHKCFNSDDTEESPKHAITGEYWAEMPELPKGESEAE